MAESVNIPGICHSTKPLHSEHRMSLSCLHALQATSAQRSSSWGFCKAKKQTVKSCEQGPSLRLSRQASCQVRHTRYHVHQACQHCVKPPVGGRWTPWAAIAAAAHTARAESVDEWPSVLHDSARPLTCQQQLHGCSGFQYQSLCRLLPCVSRVLAACRTLDLPCRAL